MKKILLLGALVLSSVVLAGCTDTANEKEANNVERQQQIYTKSQAAPFFDWSLERHLMIELYKARNDAVVTYSYVRNIQGNVIFSCNSIGFPVPSNEQLTNPESLASPNYRDSSVLPQAEPNGMYSSPSTSGTFVFCLSDDGSVSPSYFEQDVETHTAPLNEAGNSTTGKSTLKIKLKE
jgi:hypothetical protein